MLGFSPNVHFLAAEIKTEVFFFSRSTHSFSTYSNDKSILSVDGLETGLFVGLPICGLYINLPIERHVDRRSPDKE